MQSFAAKSTQLGAEILKLLNPDLSVVNPDELLLANIRLLFHKSDKVRSEALSRVLYCVSLHPDADLYLPNISNISDVIPSDICVVPNQWDATVSAATPILYTPETVTALVTSLATVGVNPKVRRVTLMQLNVIAAVPSLCKIIKDHNGLEHTIDALRNSLMTSHNVDYPDAALSAIGLLAKLCVHSFNARRELLKTDAIKVLLFRAMLLFHKNEALQRDCSIALFIVAFSDYILGETKLSVPQLLADQYHVPIVCNTHWTASPFIGHSAFTKALLSHPSKSVEWQFVRFTVASMLFTDESINQPTLIYPSCEFNPELHLTPNDCSLLQSSDSTKFLALSLHSIANATTHSAVLNGLTALQSLISFVRIDKQKIRIELRKDMINLMRRFLCVLPNTVADQQVFVAVMDVVVDIIGMDVEELHIWMLQQLRRQPQSAVLVTLQSNDSPMSLVQAVSRFVKLVVRRAVCSGTNAEIQKLLITKLDGIDANLMVFLYDKVVAMLDVKFEQREFGKSN